MSTSEEAYAKVLEVHRVEKDPIIGTARFIRRLTYYSGFTIPARDRSTGQLKGFNAGETALIELIESPEGAFYLASLLITMANDLYDLYIDKAILAGHNENSEAKSLALTLAGRFGLIAEDLSLFQNFDAEQAHLRTNNGDSEPWTGLDKLVSRLQGICDVHMESVQLDLERLQLHAYVDERLANVAPKPLDDPMPLVEAAKQVASELCISEANSRTRLSRERASGRIRATGEPRNWLLSRLGVSDYIQRKVDEKAVIDEFAI